ncbi:unnamed protein product, partial [Cyprideis torosa]
RQTVKVSYCTDVVHPRASPRIPLPPIDSRTGKPRLLALPPPPPAPWGTPRRKYPKRILRPTRPRDIRLTGAFRGKRSCPRMLRCRGCSAAVTYFLPLPHCPLPKCPFRHCPLPKCPSLLRRSTAVVRPHAPSPQQATDARKDTIELLVSERNLLTQEKDQLAHQLMAATAESESLRREVSECRERILELSRESTVLEDGRKAAEDEVVRLEREARELRDEVQRTRSSLERVTEEKVEMGSRMQELSEQQAETEKKLKETESQLRIQNLQLSQLQNVGAEVSSFQGEFERVSAEKFELEKTLAQAKERVRT